MKRPGWILVMVAVALVGCGNPTKPKPVPAGKPEITVEPHGKQQKSTTTHGTTTKPDPSPNDVLIADTGTWTNSPTSFSYQWQGCDQTGAHCTPIPGATASSYMVASTDVGNQLVVTVTAQNAYGSASRTSLATTTVTTTAFRTFYIDSAGSDANSGNSEAAPWKHAPGMANFTGSYAHQAGDEFFFKGGSTWTNSSFPLRPAGSGTSTAIDFYGANPTWYSGSSFAKPVFDAGSTNISGALDTFINLRNLDYITIQDINFQNWKATSVTTYGACAVIDANSTGGPGDQHITVNRINVSNLSIDATSDIDANCTAVAAYTQTPFAGSSIVENSTFTGDGITWGTAIKCFGNIQNNIVSHLVGMIFPCGHGQVSGNYLADCGYPTFPPGATSTHADAFQVDDADGTFYIHNNVIRDTGQDPVNLNECEAMLIGNPGETDYVYNNVLYNIHGNAFSLTQNVSPGVAYYGWNNTVTGAFDAGNYCFRAGHLATWTTIVIQNNFCVSSSGVADPALAATTLTVDHNVTLTPSQAATDGFSASSTFPYQPPPGAPTTGAGTNLTSSCTGALTDLCTTTTFAGGLAATNRPAMGAWNAGAY